MAIIVPATGLGVAGRASLSFNPHDVHGGLVLKKGHLLRHQRLHREEQKSSVHLNFTDIR
jgi:hypothetical protein